jgi:hypothetical protein
MSEETTQQTAAETNSVKNDNTKVEKNEAPSEVPFLRFKEVNDQKKSLHSENEALKSQIQEQEKKDAEAREAQLIEKNQHEVVIGEQKKLIEKLQVGNEEWTNYQKTERERLLSKLPEDQKEFGDGMDLEKLTKFVETTVKTANTLKTDSSRPAGTTTQFGGYSSIQEWASKDPDGCDEYMKNNVPGYVWGKTINK